MDGTVIWANRADGLVARAGADARLGRPGRGGSGRIGAADTADDLAGVALGGADLGGADLVADFTGEDDFLATAFGAGLAAGLAAGFAGALPAATGVLATGLLEGAFAAGFFAVGALAGGVFFAAGLGVALPRADGCGALADALVWDFTSGLLALALGRVWFAPAGLHFSDDGSLS